MTLAAYYYPRTKHGPATVRIHEIEAGRRSEIHFDVVAGAREARKIADRFDAKPWNF